VKLQKHIYEWDKIVVGGDLRSLLYAATHNYPVIFVDPSPPFRFNTIEHTPNLYKLGLSGKKQIYELELWEKMFFILGLAGLCPLSSRAQSLRAKGDVLTITTENQRVIKAKFNKLIVFEDHHMQTLPEIDHKEQHSNIVYDWFNVRYGCRHDIDVLSGDDSFISRIHFYPTDRSDNKTLKDAVAVSKIETSQLKELDFSEYMARFKVEHMMKESGIKGPINGYKKKKPIYLGIKVEHAERQVVPMVKRFYKPDERYEFRYDTLEQIIEKIQFSSYSQKVVEML
jgi:hypothetical protein